jgi:uncharacterized protein YndB with AHSA1/START domain
MNAQTIRLLLALTLGLSPLANAAVVDATPSSLQVKHSFTAAAKPEKVWQSLLHVEKWWSSAHTFSGSASNLRLEAKPGGCFCETLPDGGGVVHLTVLHVRPNAQLTLAGALGPLQTSGATGAMTFEIAPAAAGGSTVTFVYNVGGYYSGGLDSISAPVDMVLGEQLERLHRYVETGNADDVKPAK